MYTGLLHTHKLSVTLFLLLFVVKLVLLLMNRSEALEKFNKKLAIPERVVEVLFLLTGIGLLIMSAQVTTMMLIKIGVVVASIPIAIIGFKKSNKLLATLAVVLIIAAYGLAEMNKVGVSDAPISSEVITDLSNPEYSTVAHGKAIFTRNCQLCHGEDGKLGLSGSKDLTVSTLSDAEVKNLIRDGKNAMPPYKDMLSETEINAVHAYVKTFVK